MIPEKVKYDLNKLVFSNPDLIYILDEFMKGYHDIYLVGGCVRDTLIGMKCKDIDLVTDASPEELKEMFPEAKCHGQFLITVVRGVEIATYREDIFNTGKATECNVRRVRTIEEDLARRDFTCNAMAFDPIGQNIVDLYGGYTSCLFRELSFVGKPDRRIQESNARILRACRFVAVLNGSFDIDTLEALKRNAHLVNNISKEKIMLEIKKAMSIKRASMFFKALHAIGALQYIFPSLEDCVNQDGGPHHAETVFDHCMEVGDAITTKNWRLKLAGYLHDIGKPPCAEIAAETNALRFRNHPVTGAKLATKELKDLKFSNEDEAYISNLVLLHMTSLKEDFTKKAVKKFIRKLKEKDLSYKDWFKLRIADRKGNRKSFNYTFREIYDRVGLIHDILKEKNVFSLKDLAVNGQDVMNILHILPGPLVGAVLKALFEDCFNNPERNNKEFLLYRMSNLSELMCDDLN